MKILFVGNSHTYFNDMPQIFANLCKSRGKQVQVTMQAHPGVTYGWHLKQYTELRFALIHGGYDYIVMQQAAHSPCPSKEETLKDGKTIIDLAKANGVTPLQVIPWAEKRDPAHQAQMYDIYESLCSQNNISSIKVGQIFEEVFNHCPDIDMYWFDGEHASPYGSYAYACAVYAAVFGESTVGMAPVSFLTHPKYAIDPVDDADSLSYPLDADKAAVLQKLADKYNL